MSAAGVTASPTGQPTTNRHWGLFVDWCTAVGRDALPAKVETVLAFLAELPAGSVTTLRRIHAIDAVHQAAGWPAPSAATAFDELLRPTRPARFDPVLVGRALEAIPVGGWPTGIVGRRDAALVALVCTAGLTRRQVRTLYLEVDGDGQLVTPPLPVMPGTPRPGTCPACAVTRWLRVHAMVVTGGWRTVRAALADLGETPAGSDTTHDCTQPVTGPAAVGEWTAAALFPPIDPRGTPETWALSIRSITTIVASRLSAPTSSTHENGWDDPPAGRPGQAWGEADRARVLAERKAATDRLADIETRLDKADAYAETILRRLNTALNDDTAPSSHPRDPSRERR